MTFKLLSIMLRSALYNVFNGDNVRFTWTSGFCVSPSPPLYIELWYGVIFFIWWSFTLSLLPYFVYVYMWMLCYIYVYKFNKSTFFHLTLNHMSSSTYRQRKVYLLKFDLLLPLPIQIGLLYRIFCVKIKFCSDADYFLHSKYFIKASIESKNFSFKYNFVEIFFIQNQKMLFKTSNPYRKQLLSILTVNFFFSKTKNAFLIWILK